MGWVTGAWYADAWAGTVWVSQEADSASDPGTKITNTGAVVSTHSNVNICPISGFKQYPLNDPFSKLRTRWDGQVVRLKSLDQRHPQEFIESRGNVYQEGPQSSEMDDTFVSTSTAPSDL